MSEANPIACPPNNQRLTQAVSDLIWNVEHSHVAGWGDCSTDVRVDASFKELKAALAEAGGRQPYTSKPPDVSTPASANGSPTWPHVLKFAERMEAKLAKNRHKGDREGWLKDHPWSLVERILDETVEVQECFSLAGEDEIWMVKTPEETADECADVANFCMMVADSVTAQKSGNDQALPRLPDSAATTEQKGNKL